MTPRKTHESTINSQLLRDKEEIEKHKVRVGEQVVVPVTDLRIILTSEDLGGWGPDDLVLDVKLFQEEPGHMVNSSRSPQKRYVFDQVPEESLTPDPVYVMDLQGTTTQGQQSLLLKGRSLPLSVWVKIIDKGPVTCFIGFLYESRRETQSV